MAAGKIGRRRAPRLTLAILAPRRITHLALLALGAGMAQGAWVLLDAKLLAYLAGLAAPFCLLCASVVWSLRERVDGALLTDEMTAEEFSKASEVAEEVRVRSMRRAAFVAVCALFAGSPAAAEQLSGVVWQWMVILGGVAVAEAAFGYLLANAWDEQVRRHRARRLLESKRRSEHDELSRRIHASAKAGRPRIEPWSASDDTLAPSTSH